MPFLRHCKAILIKFLIIIILGACASQKKARFTRGLDNVIDKSVFENHFDGILVFDPKSRDTLYTKNSTKYFTPASNTKIYTLFAAIKLLPDKLPVLKYVQQNDTLYIRGTADGTLLHPYFKDSTAVNFLKDFENISLSIAPLEDEKFGPGWSWDDYHWYYSAERSSMPLYGNVVTVMNTPEFSVLPEIFTDSVVKVTYLKQRALSSNTFYIAPNSNDTLEIPFITGKRITKKMLEHAVGKPIHLVEKIPGNNQKALEGIAADSVYQKMMQESDNFLAEQLLIQASTILSDTLSGRKTREFVLDSLLPDLRQPPRWVDGSGLSRYNLFTPESVVHVLHKLYSELPAARLFNLFPAGGVSGTLEDWYPGNPDPYIYAKTGSLGNNHCLSGYLITTSGRTLIFSFMNNHFRRPSAEVKTEMQSIFEWVRDNY
ncbi:MAG: D-alanyl-D-alanine carboxypeptidase [Eudoraea sp.]|nr:D-alanyl-D-alanine carboxypeptidase [Eudoraea sp.]